MVNSPNCVASRMGVTEKENVALKASCSILNSVYLDFPAARSGASKKTKARLKPTHETIPRRNRWRSGSIRSARWAGRESKQKSAAPRTIFVSLKKLISQ